MAIKNLKEFLSRQEKRKKGVRMALEQILDDAARKMRNTADEQMRIVSPGKIYGNHQASLPGDYPNVDTGALVNSLFWDMDKGALTGMFGVRGNKIPHAKWLEYGTAKMEARPFMRPSFKAHEKWLKTSLTSAIKEAFKK